MKLSAPEEYGLRCLLQLGRQRQQGKDSLTIGELSRMEGISQPNVAKVMRVLRRSGFVHSIRGQAGGYALSRAADKVVVGEALAALGERFFDTTFCDRHAGVEPSCTHIGDCSIRPVLRQLQFAVDQVLGTITLASLLGNERAVAAWSHARGVPLRVVAAGR